MNHLIAASVLSVILVVWMLGWFYAGMEGYIHLNEEALLDLAAIGAYVATVAPIGIHAIAMKHDGRN